MATDMTGTTSRQRVLHLVGSPTSDFHRDLSHLYARDCLEATADESLYEFHVVDVAPDGAWRFPRALDPASLDAAETMSAAEAIATIAGLGVDVVVPQMFCIAGMTHYRALFDVLGIDYVGNTAEAMAITADKTLARGVVSAAGVRVPDGEVLRPGDTTTLVPPVVVKPADADNSLGVTLVSDTSELDRALAEAWTHSDRALVERFVELGREVRCATLVVDGEIVCLPLEEYAVDAVDKPIRDHADKLARDDAGDMRLVAKETTRAWIVDSDDPVTAVVHHATRLCHAALGCRDYGLFDFRVDPDGHPWFLEASLYCSFARTSVVTMMAGAAGIDLPELFAIALAETKRRAGR